MDLQRGHSELIPVDRRSATGGWGDMEAWKLSSTPRASCLDSARPWLAGISRQVLPFSLGGRKGGALESV
jgi:hypothetical protein